MNSVIETLLLLSCCLGWTVAYVGAIYAGFKDRTYAIPAVAVALNFSWECIYAVRFNRYIFQFSFTLLWALLDVVIIYTYLAFGRSEFPVFVGRRIFILGSILAVVLAFMFQFAFVAEFPNQVESDYAAFVQNAIMSILFISMLINRRGTRGQNSTIAISKCVGTLTVTIVRDNRFMRLLGVICCVLDIIYIGLVVWTNKHADFLLDRKAVPESREPESTQSECDQTQDTLRYQL